MKETEIAKDEKKFAWKYLIMGILALAILSFVIPEAYDRATNTQQEGVTCYDYVCTKYTLDEFEKCIDLGYEDVGFLSSEHYYLCDGAKITNTCLEGEYVETNQTTISFGMRCDKDE